MATKYEYYDTNDDWRSIIAASTTFQAQTFTPSVAHNIGKVVLKLYRVGTPGNLTVEIQGTTGGEPDNTPVCTGTVNGNTFTTNTAGEWYDITLSGASLTDSVKYTIVLKGPSCDVSNKVIWRHDSSSSTYADGSRFNSVDSGSSWTDAPNTDFMFEEWSGDAPSKATTPAPTNTATDVTLDQATITWVDGGGADTYNVYYGDTSGALSLVSSAQAGTSLTVTGITLGSPYNYIVTRYWRIDSTNAAGTTTGDEWSFTTIRFNPPTVTYFYNGEYYYLLIGSDGTYGAHPWDGGVEDTDYVVVTFEPNFIRTARKLVSVANSKVWVEDI